jgi:hypothetical protein
MINSVQIHNQAKQMMDAADAQKHAEQWGEELADGRNGKLA